MNFPKKNLKNSGFFLKCVKHLPVEKIRMLGVFPSRKDPLMTPVPNFNKCCPLSIFLFSPLDEIKYVGYLRSSLHPPRYQGSYTSF